MIRFLWNIAAKNLLRNKTRTMVSVAAIAISVCMVVLVRGLILGMLDSMFALQVQYGSGHIKVMEQQYRMKERLLSLNYTVDGFDEEGSAAMAQRLGEIPGIEKVVQRLKFGAGASINDKLIGLLGWGVNPVDELQYTDIGRKIVEGRMVEPGKPEVVLGEGILRNLNLQVGEKITIFYNTAFGSFKGATLTIVGKIDSGLKLLDDHVLYIPLDEAQRLLEMPDQVTEMLLFTSDYRKVNTVFKEVQTLFQAKDSEGRYWVAPWYKSNTMIELMKVAENVYNIIYFFLIFLASFVIINTMIMIVKERTREIGMMTAMGLRSRDILSLFIMEGITMGFVGSFIGAIIGGIGTKIMSIVGLDYTAAFEGIGEEILMSPIIYTVFSIENMVFCFVLGVLVTTVTCIMPARRAAKLEPTEALRAI